MRRPIFLTMFLLVIGASFGADQQPATDGFDPQQIIALERSAIERWGKGDTQAYLDLYADDVTYFGPGTEKRVDGLVALKKLIDPVAGKISIERSEMIGPKVLRVGDLALLTFNVIDHGSQFAGAPKKRCAGTQPRCIGGSTGRGRSFTRTGLL
jgi:ketosteroid isomerase-like protein